MPTPTCASWIIDTSFAPSPIAKVTGSKLILNRYQLQTSLCKALARTLPALTQLTTLHLDQNDISDAGGAALIAGIAQRDTIQSFFYTRNELGMRIAEGLAGLKESNVVEISFNGCKVVNSALPSVISSVLRIQKLSKLSISDISMQETAIFALISGLKRSNLSHLDLSYNQIHAPYGILCGSAGTSRSKCLPEMWKQPQSWGCSQLIFEGVAAGKGKLVFELRQGDKTLATLPPVYMDLRAVEDMYETFTVGDVDQPGVDYADTTWPAVTFTQTTGQALPAPQTAEEKDYILFVHGWNMEPWEKTAYADTMFKRLWHQCYKGRFGAFRWPTFWFDTPIPALDNFNASELHAWNSASRLKALIENRAAVFNVSGASKVRLYAHSMGNIVASECLRQFGNSAAPVHTYISAQAALSARAWDTLVPTVAPEPVMPDVFGHFWQPGSSNLNAAGWGGNPSYLAPSAMPTNTIFINHYNRLDWALANWRINTRLKPGAGYEYVPQNGCFLKSDEFPQSHYMSFPDERYDALAFAAQSYSFATGAEEGTSGKFDSAQSIDLTNYFLTPEERENNQMADKHKHHSGQFRSTIQKRWTYWREALVEMDTETPK